MSSTIKQAIDALKNRVADAYTAVANKGGTLPATQDSANLPAAINSIPSGGGMITDGLVFSEPDDYAADLIFTDTRKSNIITNPRVTALRIYEFYGDTSIQELYLPNCTSWAEGVFQYNTTIQRVECPNLATLRSSLYSFRAATSLTYVDIDSCVALRGRDFENCTNLSTLIISKLEGTYGTSSFANCTSLKKLNIPLFTTGGHQSPFTGCTNLIDIITGNALTSSSNILMSWSPTNALSSSSSSLVEPGETFANNLEKLLYNIREHIAANLPDRTGLSSLTITFSAAVKAAIQADAATAAAFTNKNWTIA